VKNKIGQKIFPRYARKKNSQPLRGLYIYGRSTPGDLPTPLLSTSLPIEVPAK